MLNVRRKAQLSILEEKEILLQTACIFWIKQKHYFRGESYCVCVCVCVCLQVEKSKILKEANKQRNSCPDPRPLQELVLPSVSIQQGLSTA